MKKFTIPAGLTRKLAVPAILAALALSPIVAGGAHAAGAVVTTPSGGASQYDISGVTNDEAATIQTNGSNVGGVFAEGTAMIIMLKLVRKPRAAV